MIKTTLLLYWCLLATGALAAIPATEVMTLYRFNSGVDIPYYTVDSVVKPGKLQTAGTLAQGTAVIPCLVMHAGRPLTSRKGTPFVGFEVVLDSRAATPQSVAEFKRRIQQRRSLMVRNHHCSKPVRHVLDARNLYVKTAGPLFAPPQSSRHSGVTNGQGPLDAIIRAFHNSQRCDRVNRQVTGRREALGRAWAAFIDDQRGRWSAPALKQARHLDYTLRTAIFEGHLGRGCSAYGACERNTIALSIRNRARGSCLKRQGCRFPGDFQGVASAVSQYNIWDEYLTQISGLTSCFLRDDLNGTEDNAVNTGETADAGRGSGDYYSRIQAMYRQNLVDVQRILFGPDGDLSEVFPGTRLSDLEGLRHYYHAPAMGKCFPGHARVEYMTAAVARKGGDFALIVNTRIRVDQSTGDGYFFRLFDVSERQGRDVVRLVDSYPGFVVDGRKVRLKPARRCTPFGIPKGCNNDDILRHRKTPPWLSAGKPLALRCRVVAEGEQCRGPGVERTVELGGVCDREMRPVTGVF